jgi:hypothetical protein
LGLEIKIVKWENKWVRFTDREIIRVGIEIKIIGWIDKIGGKIKSSWNIRGKRDSKLDKKKICRFISLDKLK